MARIGTDSGSAGTGNSQGTLTFQADGQDRIELPSSDFIADANMTRDGDNLVLQAPNGETVVIEGYFNTDPAPLLQSADGATLTPNLVEAFVRSPMEFAANGTATDESPVGAVEEVKGEATVTRADGTVETITIGTPIYQGDVIETDASGAVNIVFIDETSMAISENARLAIDEYKYDPSTESGTTNFSVLRGLFVFTSGLIGRDDPDDVSIDTPVGSIGIRGTVIAGEINPSGESKITVLEGAIVVKNGAMETVLSEQFQTVTLDGFDAPMRDIGVVPANDINMRFHTIGDVNPGLFSMINDAVKEQSVQQPTVQETQPTSVEQPSNESNARPSQSQPGNSEQAPAAASTAEAPASAPLVSDIVTLSGNESALPSIETATGQPSGGLAGTSATTNSSLPSTASSGTTGALGASPTAAPSGNAPAAGTTTTTETIIADSTQQLAPPSVTNPGSAGGNVGSGSGGGVVAPPTALTLTYTSGALNDLANAGAVIGHITAGIAGVSYVQSGTNPYYDMVVNGNGVDIVLNTAGEQFLDSGFDLTPFGNISVTATETATGLTNGGPQAFAPIIADANAGSRINLDTPQANIGKLVDNINNSIGFTVTALGDINDDGFSDFAFSNDTNAVGQNHSYIVYGYNGYLPNNSGTLPGTPRMEVVNNFTNNYNHSETVITGIGDFNGDGFEDFAIGQLYNHGGIANSSGTVAILSGAPGGGTNDVLNVDFRTYLSSSAPASSQFGQSLAGIGDFDNDGYADIAVGAPAADRLYLISGNNGAWGSDLMSSTTFIQDYDPRIDGGTHDGGDSFGTEVIALGDINGDGFSDFATNMPLADGGNGAIVIVRGNSGGTFNDIITINGGAGQGLGEAIVALGDINGDGRSDFMASDAAGVGHIYMGSAGGYSGGARVDLSSATNFMVTGGGGVGDFNGDGVDDFSITGTDSGRTYNFVVFGKTGGQIGSSTVFDVDYLKDPANAIEFRSGTNVGMTETIISPLGDINGDGYEDFSMSVQDINGGAAGNGGAYIVYGRNTGQVDATGNNLSAAADGNSLVGTTGNDVLFDNNVANVSMRGGAGVDRFEISNTSFQKIDGGSNAAGGYDTIHAIGNLDFSGVDFERVSGIERLEFNGSNQTITLSVENLFNLLKSSDGGILRIDTGAGGTANQSIVFSDGAGGDGYNVSEQIDLDALLEAQSGSNVTWSNGGGFDTFQIGGYQLIIADSITIDAQ